MEQFEEQIHRESKNVKLLTNEKAAIRARILTQSVHTPSPYFPFMPVVFRGIAIVFVLAIGAAVPLTYGAQLSRPGDLLYSLEIEIVEPIEESLHFSSKARFDYHIERLEERLSEVQKIEREEKEMTQEASDLVLQNVNEHADAVVEQADEALPSEESVNQLVRATAILEAHSETFDELDIVTSTLNGLSDTIDTQLEESAEAFAEQEDNDDTFAATIVDKLDDINDSLLEVDDAELTRELEVRLMEATDAVTEGDLISAYELTTEIEVVVLTQQYLESGLETNELEALATTTPR
jgi:hypothetical protein